MSKKNQTPVRRHFPWLFLSVVLLFCVWMTYLYGVFYIPSLPREEIPPFLPSDTIPTTEAATEAATEAITQRVTEEAAVTETQIPQTTSSTVCAESNTTSSVSEKTNLYSRREGVYNILCAGRDEAAYNTDVLMLVSFDTKNGSASVVQIPRDTYLDGGKINALWAKKRNTAKKNGSASVDADAMDMLCRTLQETLCIRIDHWVLCNLQALRETVDALGGVTVDVPCDMHYDDPAQNLSIHLSAGTQLLNGAQAEGLVRFRSDYVRGDLGRVDAQKLFLSALLAKAKEISVLRLPALLKTAAAHLSTDLSLSDLLYFAKSAQKLDMSNVSFLTLPGTDCREYGDSGAWYYVLSRQGVWETVNTHLNVYQTSVDDRLFDRDYRLTNPKSPTLLSYYKTYLTAKPSTAEGIEERGIPIALTAEH